MSNRRKRVILWSTFSVCVFVLLGMLVPLVGARSNCGGNSAALAQCGLLAMRTRVEASEGSFQPQQWSQYGRDEVVRINLKLAHWTVPATYLVRTNLTTKAADKTVVAVCDTPFENVPKPTIWNLYRKNAAHAVGYVDGSKGLITPDEFSKLDLTNFVDVATLAPALASAQPPKQ